MALQDLTPQLRTRLSRMERAVGWFVILAVALLGFGFVYYAYNTAERKGWFLTKAPYFTFVESATGLKVGDPVKLMGFDAGSIIKISPMPANQFTYNVYVEFVLKSPNYGYIWTEGSEAKITTADLLGKRQLEVTKGSGGYPTYIFHPLSVVTAQQAETLPDQPKWALAQEVFARDGTNLVAKPFDPLTNLAAIAAAGYPNIVVMDTRTEQKSMTGIWDERESRYDEYTTKHKPFWLRSAESPAVTDQLQKLVGEVEAALPGVFALTNQLAAVLSNGANLASNLNVTVTSARPVVSNLAAATAHLDQPGALGEWLLPTNINRNLEVTLANASKTLATAGTTLTNANTNLTALVENLNLSLDNLASITSNLNNQVQANTNMLSAISDTVVHTDQFIQGLKRFWLFRSLFKNEQPKAPPPPPPHPLRSPKEKGQP